MLSSSRRSKGNSFEYDCEYSLKAVYPDIRATERRGFAEGYDLISEYRSTVFECKFHKSITWNELEGIYKTLEKRTLKALARFVIFKTNMQPVLVFDGRDICKFETQFCVEWQKRPKKAKVVIPE